MNTRVAVMAGLLLGASLVSCAPRSNSTSLDARVEQQNVQIQRLSSQVGQVEDSRPGQAELWAQMQSMRQELNALNGKMYDVQQGGGGSAAELEQRVTRLENVVRQMASQLAINVDSLNAPISTGSSYNQGGSSSSYSGTQASPYAGVAGTVSSAGAGPSYPIDSGAGPVVPDAGAPAGSIDSGAGMVPDAGQAASAGEGSKDTATTLYEAGIKAFDDRKYQDAVMSFKDFTSTFPKHNLAGNAHFWQGESYFQLKDYARAALAYQEVIGNYPGSPKVQSSMLKQGISLYHADKKPAASERLKELIKRYPNSPEATRAKQFLAKNK